MLVFSLYKRNEQILNFNNSNIFEIMSCDYFAYRGDGSSLCPIMEGTQVTRDLRTSFVPFLVSIRSLIAKFALAEKSGKYDKILGYLAVRVVRQILGRVSVHS